MTFNGHSRSSALSPFDNQTSRTKQQRQGRFQEGQGAAAPIRNSGTPVAPPMKLMIRFIAK